MYTMSETQAAKRFSLIPFINRLIFMLEQRCDKNWL